MSTSRGPVFLRTLNSAAEHERCTAVSLAWKFHVIGNASTRADGLLMNDASDPIGGGQDETPDRYFLVLGTAAADLWSNLPQELQHTLFERAVVLGHKGERDESLREQLAKFLHDHHARTLAR
jgi:hypothetical protein